MSHYKHFTTEEREKTMVLLATGYGIRGIAKGLGRSPSTISREIRRNSDIHKGYSPSIAEYRYKKRRKKCRPKYKLSSPALAAHVEEKLRQKWSPEQICGRAKLEGNPLPLSFSTIYRAVDKRVLPIELHKEMRIKRKYRIRKNSNRGKIINVLTIHDRPQSVKNSEEVGHWESDTVHGKHGTGDIATHVERKTGYLVAIKLENLMNKSFNIGTEKAFNCLPSIVKRSFTVDRGSEFMAHKDLTARTGMSVYFCDAGRPGQRGLNENTNGLLRQYFPKNMSFRELSQEVIDKAVADLNNRPRKRFGFKTPAELFMCCT